MDIKLKSNKINPILKTIIFLLTLVFAFLAGTSSLQLIRQAIYFNYETENFTNTPAFIVNAEDKIIELSNNAGMVSFYGQNMTYEDFCNNEINNEYLKSEYNENLEEAYNYFDEIQAIKKLEPKIDGTSYDADYDIFYDKNNNEYGTIEDFKMYGEGISSTADNNEYTAPSPANRSPSETFETTVFYYDSEIIPETEENKDYTDALIYETHAEWEYDYAVLRRKLFSIVTDARSKETIKTELQNKLNEQLNEAYEDEKWRLYTLREKYSNIDFYIQDNTSGNYISNFEKDSDIKNLKENYKTNALFYFHYDGRNIKTTPTNINLKESFLIFALEELGIISEKIDTEMLAEIFGDTTVFVKINNPEIASDAFFTLKQSFDENKFLIPVELKTQTILFSILTLSGIVALAILSKPKYKDGVLKLPFNKRILFFIHLLFFIALVVLIISGIGLSVYEDYTSNLLNFTQEFVFLLNNDSITIIVGILFALLVLTIINFVNY
ncbi:MAG: hypothetical protein IKC01_07155, partial [Clostridia bacterium]|nr:hypothetical protein [Clostridia bacterium]